MELDQVSRRIIGMLQRDGRCPHTVMARAVGISESAVRARVQALTSAGVLQIVGLTDPGSMGFGVMAMVGVQASNDLHHIAELVSAWPETTYVVISAGSFDLLVELVCEDNNDLLRLVEQLRAVEGVRSTETFIYISRHKLNYAWAPEAADGYPSPDGPDDTGGPEAAEAGAPGAGTTEPPTRRGRRAQASRASTSTS